MASQQEAAGYCRKCGTNVLVKRPGTNHVLHLLLSIVTMGFWLPIWILVDQDRRLALQPVRRPRQAQDPGITMHPSSKQTLADAIVFLQDLKERFIDSGWSEDAEDLRIEVIDKLPENLDVPSGFSKGRHNDRNGYHVG